MTIEKLVFDTNTEYRTNELILNNVFAVDSDKYMIDAVNRYLELKKIFEKYKTDLIGNKKSKVRIITNCNNEDLRDNINDSAICVEYLNCRILDNENCDFKTRLKSYIYSNNYYEDGEFNQITNNYGNLTAFQSHLRCFIREFNEKIISDKDNIYLCLDKNGEFSAKVNKQGKDISLQLEENAYKIFQFLCFLEVNRFWDEIDEMVSYRPMHIPLLISQIMDGATVDNPDFREAINYGKKLENQIIVYME